MEFLSFTAIVAAGGALLHFSIQNSIDNFYKKQLESHKSALKNSEKIFNYKLKASVELYKIIHQMMPEKNHPDMDWSEACELIAQSFHLHEKALDNFLCKYQAALSENVFIRIKKAVYKCSEGRFEFDWDSSTENAIVTSKGIHKAEELCKSLDEAMNMLRQELRAMTLQEIKEK